MARKSGHRRGRDRAEAPPAPGQRERPSHAGHVLWIALCVLTAARLVLAFVPNMWLWGLNVQRFVEPILGWAGWGLMAAALVPGVASRLERPASWLGNAIGGRSWLPMAAAAVAGASLVLVWPDRVRFTGDFLLRQGTVEERGLPAELFPQALPLDVAFHYTFPVAVSKAGLVDANGYGRAIGALEAALLGALAVAFARTLAFRGGAANAAAGIVFFGGYLGLFTGYSKALADLVVVCAAVAVFGLQTIREGRSLLWLGVAFALGAFLHRSALGLFPAVALAWFMWLRDRARGEGLRAALSKPVAIAAFAIPIAILVAMLPRVLSTAFGFDAVHFNPAEAQAAGGPWRAAFSGTRPIDALNMALMLSPLCLVAPLVAVASGLKAPGREAWWLASLAAPFLLVSVFLHPIHGMFRDWEVFACAGVALSLVTARVVGVGLSGEGPRLCALGVAVCLSVAVPSFQNLALHAEVERGFARVKAFVTEPPERGAAERGHAWDYVGIRNVRLQRWDAAAEALERAAETAPSPRILRQWAIVETQRGDLHTAQRLYWRMLAKAPEDALGWLELADVSSRMGDIHETRYAAQRLIEGGTAGAEGKAILRYLDDLPPAIRDSLERRYPPRDSAARGW